MVNLGMIFIGGLVDNYLTTRLVNRIAASSYSALGYNLVRGVFFLVWFKGILDHPTVGSFGTLLIGDMIGTWLALWRINVSSK